MRQSLPIKAGSRSSPLALIQVEEIKALLKKSGIRLFLDLTTYKTQGDIDKKTPLTSAQDDDFFTDTIDQALLDKKIDVAIHSAKDLPQHLHEGLEIFALTNSLDETDAFIGKTNFNALKKGAKIGTSSLIRQTSIKELNPHLVPVDIRGTIQERIHLIDKGTCDGIIVATAALKRLKLDSLIKDIMPWESTPLQGQLAVVGRRGDHKLKEIFSTIDIRRSYGTVYLVGAGPGAPDLITLKGIRSLEKCDVVFYDYLTDKSLLKYASRAEKIYAGKRKGDHTLSQSKLSRMLKEKAIAGKTVVRLKGGDPLIFGRGPDEINYLRAYHIPVEIVPGLSSATALPSLLGIPLTARDVSSSVAFLSAHGKDEIQTSQSLLDIPKVDTVVLLMGLSKLDIIVKSFLAKKWPKETPVVIISNGTRPNEIILKATLKDIELRAKEENLQAPALIVVGNIVNFYTPHPKPFILYTGTNPENYAYLGQIISLPMIEIKSLKLTHTEQRKLRTLAKNATSILLTSRFGVKHFLENVDKSELLTKKFITIGDVTAEALRAFGIEPFIVSMTENSPGLLREIKTKVPLNKETILFPRSKLPNPFLKKNLTKAGAKVYEFPVYDNIKPKKRDLPKEPIEGVVFTSPSTVENFLKDYARIPRHWKIYSKGILTQEKLNQSGYPSETLS